MDSNAIRNLIVRITADTAQFQAGMDKVAGSTAMASASAAGLGTKLQSVGGTMSAVGSTLMPLSLGAAAALGLSAKAAADFEQKMELIATQAGASQKEVDSLKDSVLALAPVVGQSPAKLADALFFIESAGFRGAKAMDLLKLAAEGADIGQANLADTANALTSVMNTQIQGAQTATETMSNLNAIVGAGKMHFQDLNDAIGTGFVNTAKLFGISLDSVGAALDQLTKNGEPAANAATRLSMMITLMGAPTNQAAKVLTGIGLSAEEVKASTSAMTDALAKAHVTTNQLADDMRQPNGINVAIQDLKSHLVSAGLGADEAAAVIARAFGGGRTSKPVQALIQDTQGLNDTFKQITTTSGNFADSWAKQQQTANQKFQDFKAMVDVVAVKLGTAFLPALTDMAASIGKVADSLSKLSPSQLNLLVDSLTALALLAPGLKLVGGALSTIGDALTSDITKNIVGFLTDLGGNLGSGAVSAITGLKNVIVDLSGWAATSISDAAKMAGAWVTGAAESASAWVASAASTAADWVALKAAAIASALESAGAWLAAAHSSEYGAIGSILVIGAKYAWLGITSAAEAIKSAAVWVAESAKSAAITAWNWTSAAIKSAAEWVIQLPKVIAEFVLTSAGAVKEAIVSSAAWVASAVKSAAAWVAAKVEVIADFLLMTAQSIATGTVMAAQFVASAVKAVALGVAVEGVGLKALAVQTIVSTPVALAISVTAALALIAFVMMKIDELHKAMDGLAASQAQGDALDTAFYKSLAADSHLTTAQKKARANAYDKSIQASSAAIYNHQSIFGFASGVQNFQGGLAIVGENGPELVNLPAGSSVHSNSDSKQMLSGAGGGSNVTLNVTVGNYLGAPGDLRSLAKDIYQELMRVARSNGVQLPQIGVRAT